MVGVHAVMELRGHGGHGGRIRMGWVAGVAMKDIGWVAHLLLRSWRVVGLDLWFVVTVHYAQERAEN